MWRSFFLAIGIMMVIVGAECMIIDSATLYQAAEASATNLTETAGAILAPKPKKVVAPSEWLPWTLLSAGAIVVLYAMTLPKRWGHA